jgi:hypothetical protein
VKTAAKLVREPVFEVDLDPSAYDYRPKRSGPDAVPDRTDSIRRLGGLRTVHAAGSSAMSAGDSELATHPTLRGGWTMMKRLPSILPRKRYGRQPDSMTLTRMFMTSRLATTG